MSRSCPAAAQQPFPKGQLCPSPWAEDEVALGRSRHCSPWHTAASPPVTEATPCSEPPTHPQLYEEKAHLLMKPGLEVMKLLAPESQGPGQSHLVQLTCWQAAGSPVAHGRALAAAPGTGLSMQPHVRTLLALGWGEETQQL